MQCHICRETVSGIEQAADEGWLASVWLNDDVQVGPLCPRCGLLLTRNADDGETELLPSIDSRFIGPPEAPSRPT